MYIRSHQDRPDNSDQKSPIVILCEQDWDQKSKHLPNITEMYGIKYAQYLRRVEKRRNPIIFTSFLSINILFKLRNTDILTAIGHGFVQLPNSVEEFEKTKNDVEPLEEIQLNDIILNFCLLRSVIREGFHSFKGQLREIKGNTVLSSTQKEEQYEIEFNNYLKELQKEGQEAVINEFKNLIKKYREDNLKDISYIESVQEEQFTRFLTDEESEENIENRVEQPEVEVKSWKILFLDDRPDELEQICQILKKRKISYTITSTFDEARWEIENDSLNQYTVIVSDYRLYQKNKTHGKSFMQKKQGYDFLIWVADQKRYNSLIALSGLSKSFLMDSFRHQQINVKVYSKNGLLGGGQSLFVDDIEYLGKQQFEAILSIPKTSEWENQLKNYYIWLRTECNYASALEEKIAFKANSIIEQLDGKIKIIYNIKYNENSQEDQNARNRLLFLEDYSGKGQGLASLPSEKKINEKYIDLFVTKLIYRRVLIYYLITKTIEPNIVAKILSLGSADAVVYDNKKKVSKDFMYTGPKKQFFSQQALSEEDIPFNILIEEKNWLRNKMGIEIINGQIRMSQLYDLLLYTFDLIRNTNPKFTYLPKFSKKFKSGKHIILINKDLIVLLEELKKMNDPEMLNVFLNKLEKILYELDKLLEKFEMVEILIKTLKKYYYGT